MIIRTVLTSDLSAVQNLICASFNPFLHTYMVSIQQGAEYYLGVFVKFADFHPDRYLLLAESESNELLGFADFRLLDGGIGFLSNICVAELARGQGIAKNLILRCLEHFPEIHTMQLDVFDNNHAAKTLYRKLGFQAVSHNFWLTRPCPDVSTHEINQINLRFENLPSSIANFEKYGFCEIFVSFRGRRIKVGRLGESVLRCFQPQDYADDMLLTELKCVFPLSKEAFIVIPMNSDIDGMIDSHRIVHSIRMSWNVSNNISRETY